MAHNFYTHGLLELETFYKKACLTLPPPLFHLSVHVSTPFPYAITLNSPQPPSAFTHPIRKALPPAHR